MNYFFHPDAETEHLEAIAFYESKIAGLGASYLIEFEKNMKFVCDTPRGFPIVKQPDIRRAQLNKFPFAVLYRESSGVIQVLAIAHHRRRPQFWRGRV